MFAQASKCFSLILAGLALAPSAVTAFAENHQHARPHHVRKAAFEFDRSKRGVFNSTLPVTKRAAHSGVRATFYNVEVGKGACGRQARNSDFTIALNGAEFGNNYPSPRCFEKVNIRYNGKSATAEIWDKCPDEFCSWGQIDLSEGLFKYFSSPDAGIIYVDWDYGSGGGGGDNDPPEDPKPKPKPTPKPAPKPATTEKEDEPTTTSKARTTSKEPEPTTTSTTEKTSSSSSSSSASSSSSESLAAATASLTGSTTASAPSGSPSVGAKAVTSVSSTGGNINNLYQLLLQFGEIAS